MHDVITLSDATSYDKSIKTFLTDFSNLPSYDISADFIFTKVNMVSSDKIWAKDYNHSLEC